LAAAFYGAGYLVERKFEVKQGNSLGLAAGLTTGAIGASRYFKTKRFMPGGILVGLGTIAASYHGMKLKKLYA
jgi:uncharacterized membrane protein (UPF0136 family)